MRRVHRLVIGAILVIAQAACGGGRNDETPSPHDGPCDRTGLEPRPRRQGAHRDAAGGDLGDGRLAASAGRAGQGQERQDDERRRTGLGQLRPDGRRVSKGGLLTPIRAGTATVTASASGATGSTLVTVRDPVAVPTRSRYVGTNLAGIAYWSTAVPVRRPDEEQQRLDARSRTTVSGTRLPRDHADGYPAALKPGQHAVNCRGLARARTIRPAATWCSGTATARSASRLSNVTVAEASRNRIAIDVTDTTGPLWVSHRPHQRDQPGPQPALPLARHRVDLRDATVQPRVPEEDAPFSMLRFMDWGATNGSPVVEWADRSARRRPHLCQPERRAARGDDRTREHAARRSVVLHPAPGQRRLCSPVRDAAARHARPDPASAHRVLERGLEHRLRADALGGRRVEPARPAHAVRAAVGCSTRSAPCEIFKIIAAGLGADSAPARARPGRAGGLDPVPRQRAGLEGDTAVERRRPRHRALLQRRAAGKVENVDRRLTMSSDQVVDQMLASSAATSRRGSSNAALATSTT